jgi:hypothetical protein
MLDRSSAVVKPRTFISLVGNASDAAERSGHSNAAVTLGIYADARRDRDAATVQHQIWADLNQ